MTKSGFTIAQTDDSTTEDDVSHQDPIPRCHPRYLAPASKNYPETDDFVNVRACAPTWAVLSCSTTLSEKIKDPRSWGTGR
jgi:hypothetical protein